MVAVIGVAIVLAVLSVVVLVEREWRAQRRRYENDHEVTS